MVSKLPLRSILIDLFIDQSKNDVIIITIFRLDTESTNVQNIQNVGIT